MSRRVSLPGADELFGPGDDKPEAIHAHGQSGADVVALKPGRSSGRVKHDEKITVYVTSDELYELEDTRLNLRRQHGVAVDRGRIVREAVRIALEGVEVEGDDSALVRRLREGR